MKKCHDKWDANENGMHGHQGSDNFYKRRTLTGIKKSMIVEYVHENKRRIKETKGEINHLVIHESPLKKVYCEKMLRSFFCILHTAK
jgi:hypothetical protein